MSATLIRLGRKFWPVVSGSAAAQGAGAAIFEEDEKEMVSIIKSFKSKKIKSSKKSLDLKKFRNTVKEETLELRK